MPMVLTVDEVRLRVSRLESLRWDDEAAHSEEDSIWRAVLQAIADGADNPKELAAEALTTKLIDFARWCA